MTTRKPKEIVLQNNDRIPGVFFTVYLWNIRESCFVKGLGKLLML